MKATRFGCDESGHPVSRIDGVRVEYEVCWGMIRPSVTEPILTLRFEGKTRERLLFIADLILSVLPGEISRRAHGAVLLAGGPLPPDGQTAINVQAAQTGH